MGKKTYITVGLISFLVALVMMFPAKLAYQIAQPLPGSIQLHGISGSIWSGHARQLTANQVNINMLGWQLSALDLLGGQYTINLDGLDSQYPLQGQISLDGDQYLEARGLKGVLPASLLSQINLLSFVSVDGQLQFNIEELLQDQGVLQRASGNIRLINARLLQPVQGLLGTLVMQIQNRNQDIVMNIRDEQAPIGVDGSITVKPNRQFRLNMRLQPTSKADPILVRLISNAAQRQPDGSLLIRYDGVY